MCRKLRQEKIRNGYLKLRDAIAETILNGRNKLSLEEAEIIYNFLFR